MNRIEFNDITLVVMSLLLCLPKQNTNINTHTLVAPASCPLWCFQLMKHEGAREDMRGGGQGGWDRGWG